MSIFTKPLSQLATEDLQEMLQDGAVENVRLEFKSEVPDKDETLKKLSSFANTFGGFMVVGAKANSKDGRLEALPGVVPEAGYKQKVVAWCFQAVSPPLTVEVSDAISAPGSNGKVCYVIHTAESDATPHFLNGRKGIWIRTDEFSTPFRPVLADEHELRYLFDRRKLTRDRRAALLERAKKRFDTSIAKTHTDRGGNRTPFGPKLELCVVPRFPTHPLCEQQNLQPLIVKQENVMHCRGQIFPNITHGGVIAQHESAIVLNAAPGISSIFEANVWGMLFYGTSIASTEHQASGIHLHRVVGSLLLFVMHAGRMLPALGYSGPIYIQATVSPILGIRWLYAPNGVPFTHSGSELDDEVTFSISSGTEELRDKADRVVMILLRSVLFSVNWAGQADNPQNLEALIRKGYEFNSWAAPTSLQV